ncbi:MAG: ATP-dependent protease ATPase subunit HslU [Clostridia bacterium]|nr:ATP-dependent protease ATPase subunit HslU [Clostridia bacterium]
MELFTPKEIVQELDKYIIGQDEAKRSVAVALRNRYRRSRLDDAVREEITPKNIIMKGPTGVGKTEIARRLAKLVKAPLVKVEATKFTEVGYVGRDVESMVRDLVEAAIRLVKEERYEELKPRATQAAVQKLVKVILPIRKELSPDVPEAQLSEAISEELTDGKLDEMQIEIEVSEPQKPVQMMQTGQGAEINLGDIFKQFGGGKNKKKRKLYVKDAMRMLILEESDKLIDTDSVAAEALRRAEQEGIIFIDEIDKIAGSSMGSSRGGPDVSREGVQRDILPIVEGSTVTTKYGSIRTDFILFIAAGAFHISEVKDLIPELQGRFPVVVELNSLTKEDFVRILTEPSNALLKMYSALLKVDGVDLKFTKEAIEKIAELASLENTNSENIGARRLHSLIEALLSDVSYEANGEPVEVVVDLPYVEKHLGKQLVDLDLKRYII